MGNLSNRVIIFSVFRPEFKGRNLSNHREVLISLIRHGAVEVEGCYKGETELSIMIPYNNQYILDLIKRSANLFNQESILVTSGDRSAKLIYKDGHEEYLGQLRAVPMAEAMSEEAWTYVPSMDTYFITK